MWQSNILTIVREVSDNESINGFVIIFMLFIIVFLVIYILNKNKV